MLVETPDDGSLVWRGIPHPEDRAICNVHLMQAGGLNIPTSLVLLPEPNKPSPSFSSLDEANQDQFYAPDFCFLIEQPASGTKYIFDLGMRRDLENSPPAVLKGMLPNFECFPQSPAKIMLAYGSQDQMPESIRAIIFSHLHFDHVGDAGARGLQQAELWVGPTSMTAARPGYPVDPQSSNWSVDFPADGSKNIVEFTLPTHHLTAQDESRLSQVQESKLEGKYEGVEQRIPQSGWFPLGAFDRAFDLFGDASAYWIDAPGHMPGHTMLLLRVKVNRESVDDDDFILLAGDCYHHPLLLADPRLTARPPYSQRTMHGDPRQAVDTMARTSIFARHENVWVVGAHDPTVVEALSPGKPNVEGLKALGDWRTSGWKEARNL